MHVNAHATVVLDYKPTLAAWGQSGVRKPDSWLGIVQSQYHDIKPAKALGFKTAWIERRHDQLVPTSIKIVCHGMHPGYVIEQ